MRVGELDATVVNYINEVKSNYEQKITELQTHYKKEIHELRKKINELIEVKDKEINNLKEQLDLLIYKRFMRSAEQIRCNDKQPLLFTNEAEPEAITEQDEKEEEKTEVKSYSRKKAGRKPIDEKIPRRPREIDIPESEKTCACGTKMTRIGEETSEKLVIIPQQVYVDQIIRPKYACRCCEGTEDEDKPAVRIAPTEPSMIPRGMATPSLLATIFTHKFVDHLPYDRQEKMFDRIGVGISKQNMSNWQQYVYNKLSPLFALMKETAKSGPVMQMDETPVQVMSGIKTKKEDKKAIPPDEEHKPDIKKGYMWLARGGPPGKKVIWYEYRDSRAGKHAKEFLEGYKGYLQTDGYEGYNYAVKENPGIIHAGCFAHARRKFFEASKATKKPQSAEEGIKYIRKLYDLEDRLRSENLSEEKFVENRKAEAKPILDQFKSWLLMRSAEIPPSNLMGTALSYTLNQWDKLAAYLENYHLTPDNNACENAIRPFVIGRKNWLFSGSPEGARSSCGIYSLIETAKQNGLSPFKYLMAVFEKAPLASSSDDWEKLLPWNIENL